MKVFVIMPFDSNFNDVYASIKLAKNKIRKHISSTYIRLDDIEEPGRITEDLLRELQECSFCIADITNNNPNVMWEVGYAMALNKKIIFISQNLETLPFDLQDMRILKYDRNSLDATLVKPLTKRIRSTLTPSITTKNTSQLNTKKENLMPFQLSDTFISRGNFTEFIADSALTLGSVSNPVDIYKELLSSVQMGGEIDLKHHYLGVIGASNWVELSNHPAYEHTLLKTILSSRISEIIKKLKDECNCTSIDLVSLGTGDGELDKVIISKLIEEQLLNYFYGIDISIELLQKAITNIVSNPFISQNLKLKAILGDFNQLTKYRNIYAYDSNINLFSILGFTFGNYQEAELLGKIKEGMNNSDFLLIDAKLHQLGNINGKIKSKDIKTDVRKFYQYSVNNKFALTPLEISTSINYSDVKDNFDVEINNSITVVPNAINIITVLNPPNNIKIRLKNTRKYITNNKIKLASTTLYNYNDLLEWVATRGFILKYEYKSKNIAVLLFQKHT